jgi:endonuclease YncB( thermonuclease family)
MAPPLCHFCAALSNAHQLLSLVRSPPLNALKIMAIASMCIAGACNAQDQARDAVPAHELTFTEIFASRPGDARTYFLLGGGWLRTIQSGNPGKFISGWLKAHPSAIAKPVSRMFSTNTKSKQTSEEVYIWVEDGKQSLNEDLVRQGVFPAGVMYDMVDNRKGLDELLKDPKLADTKAQIEKEREEAPQDIAERLMPDAEYQADMQRIEAAEALARKEKLGIWSDGMKEEREAEGYP